MADLILLHGPPASGKLTIAKELNEIRSVRVFHNHLTLDVAKAIYEFGEPGFWDLVHELRLLAFKSFFQNSSDTVVTTWCYEDPEDRKFFLALKAIAEANKGRVLPVHLNCSIKHLEDRVVHDNRRVMKKLCDVQRLRTIMAEKNYTAVPDGRCMEINSGEKSAASNALEIVTNFNL